MLDNGTKKRIDSARDILVGKVPDPKSQVEQITIAMIYKFMDDMDNQTEELGGKATFFAGEFKQYSWSRLLDRKLSGHERLLAYAEGIEKMNINENIPQLFRDIFKGAFLPYRDPETLNLFLKEINGFNYDHSERLGDAFEYLLSVLSSQGDAGQFRTPRHIIDFIVEIVNPAKEDTVLDPACGTAGFLISSYKHILSQNTNLSADRHAQAGTRPGDLLTTDDKGRLMTNFCGYDISPDMVRLSLVNMYLHSFANPSIYEYDTLTSEDRWDERYDVIMANPPFMSPKGGIRPHSRFTIKAKRSEVLFVDYIAEHLNVHGRAGVIVPEGIIFQSQNAYKNLRKMLIEEGYLYAVISLPAGVFQPYSGVKTSILIMDKTLAKKTSEILFVKVANDGFDLGAQRRPIDKNDLPGALGIVKAWKQAIGEGKGLELNEDGRAIAHTVSKKKIAESGDYNLSGDRYKEVVSYANVKWPMVKLEEIVDVLDSQRKPIKKADRKPGPYPYYGATGVLDYVDNYIFDEELVLVGEDGAKWAVGEKTAFVARGKFWVNNHAHVLRPNFAKVKTVYLVNVLNDMDLNIFITGVTVPKLNQKRLRSIRIPLPPLEVQEKIVAELDGYQKIIDGAKQIVENYKPTIKIDPDWPIVGINSICDVRDGTHDSPKYQKTGFPLVTSKNVREGKIDFTTVNLISKEDLDKINKRSRVDHGDIIMPMIGTIGNPIIVMKDREFAIKNIALIKFHKNSRINRIYLKSILESDLFSSHYLNRSNGSTQKFISLKFIRGLPIPLPPLEVQQKIVAEIESERELVEANKKLIKIFEKKIKDKIGEVWGE